MYVCEDCIEDDDLQDVVRRKAISEECEYCDRVEDHPIACELGDVVERVRFAVYQEYSEPYEETMYDPEEGDFHGNVLEHTELFYEVGFQLRNEKLWDAIVSTFWDERFCRKGMLAGSTSERRMDAWDAFKSILKHERRYTFWTMDDADHGISEHPPSEMIQNVFQTIEEFDLVKTLDVGASFWRVRIDEKPLKRAAELATPTAKQAAYSNRMSAAGVPMFYGADEMGTAISETLDVEKAENKTISACAFQSTQPLLILDLLDLPRYGFFSDWTEDQRQALDFLEAFQSDISQPIKKDGREHIEYVPTQVLTEYVRYQLKHENRRFDGVRYRSSRDGTGCYVLFFDQDDCLNGGTLRFDRSSLTHIPAEEWTDRSFESGQMSLA